MPLGELITGIDSSLRQRRQLRAGFGQRHAVADEEHRPLAPRGANRPCATSSASQAPLRRAVVAVPGAARATSASSWKRLYGTSRLTGPGRPAGHGVERLPQRQRQHVDARRLEAALHHRAG